MKASELIELVDMGKIVLVLSNLETRYDKNLILDAYKCNPAAVVGRRGLNALLATYLIEIKNQYEKRIPGIFEIASKINMQGIKNDNSILKNIILAFIAIASCIFYTIGLISITLAGCSNYSAIFSYSSPTPFPISILIEFPSIFHHISPPFIYHFRHI